MEVGLERLGELLKDRKSRLWLDISDPGEAEVALLRREFGFHELALEDVTKPHERTRCDAYGSYYFVVVYAAEHAGKTFVPRELNLFWGENYFVTIHRRPQAVLAVLDEARRRWEHHEGRKAYGIACLAYTLFESLVDGYFTVQDRVREQMEGIEESILTGTEGTAADLFKLRKELLVCRGCWRRPATSWRRSCGASARSLTGYGRTSRMSRITRFTSSQSSTPIETCSAPRSTSTFSPRSIGSASS
jgi:magnesium transporter